MKRYAYAVRLQMNRFLCAWIPRIMLRKTYLKSKSTLMLFDRHLEYLIKWGERHFWVRRYYVSTIENVSEETILKYIQE